MKKRTAFIGAILSLIPLGNPLILKTSLVLSLTGLMLSVPEKINAETFEYYFKLAYEKGLKGDYYGAISDYTKAIEINPKKMKAYGNRGISKEKIGDLEGACNDWRKASSLGDERAAKWVRDQCER